MKKIIVVFLYLVIGLSISFGQGTAYLLKFIPKNEPAKIITQEQSDLPLAPASTLKLFTSWMGLNKGLKDYENFKEILKKSDNKKADEMFTKLGGSTALKTFLLEQMMGINDKNFVAYDGSGLSGRNRTTCELQVCLLEKIFSDTLYPTFKQLMAQPGQPGTLEKRLLNHQGKVFAKTGTLNGTIALTGFYELENGVALFAINSYKFKTTWEEERKRIDAILESLINQIPKEDSSKN